TPSVQISSAYAPTGYTAAFTGNLDGYANGRALFLPLGSLNVGRVTRFDARLTKTFPFTERMKAMFTFDAFNVFNHPYFTGVNTREYIYSLVGTVPTLTYQSNVGTPTASQGFPDGTDARRLQIGLRFIW